MTCRSEVRRAVVTHAREASPAECCGLLLGSGDLITEAVPIGNIADSPGRYLLDPAEHIAARRLARERGLEVVGFYHSHPHSAPQPSPTDIAEAAYPGHAYLIVGLASEPPEMRLFEWSGRQFDEIELRSES